jgi:hypothetical protein
LNGEAGLKRNWPRHVNGLPKTQRKSSLEKFTLTQLLRSVQTQMHEKVDEVITGIEGSMSRTEELLSQI